MTVPLDLLQLWLARQLATPARAWFEQQMSTLSPEATDRALYMALGLAPRKLGKDDLALLPADLEQAGAARPGWDPSGLSVDQAARIAILLKAGGEGERFRDRFVQLCRTADMAEQVAFYRGLPLYPNPELLAHQAGEAARTNMRSVFEALAHRNPYPFEQFDDNRWNHMVLKALFIGSVLHPIQGLGQRANAELARILRDYAHERWAAGREVTPELWRCVVASDDTRGDAPNVDEGLEDLRRALEGDDPLERQGAALALAASSEPKARALLETAPDLAKAIDQGQLSWDSLAKNL
ncbi:MAG: EboA domain-containing protein [Alphaproteobacteria bacterium]|nr:EboA domain-containing protein [Alphaproteobacteria bacterium]